MAMRTKLVTVFLLCISLKYASSTIGLDAIGSISTTTFKCLYNSGYRFYIGRVWRSLGVTDSSGIQNIKNARAAGFKYVDGYIFPCHSSKCGSAASQVKAAVNALKAANAQVGMLWMDIERLNWPSSKTTNRQFVLDMVNTAKSLGYSVGIYSGYYSWEEIVGLSWSGVSSYPLWWPKYDGVQSFSSFKSYGGWKKPAMKQYRGDVKGACGVEMDLNWY